mgnify:CR=1 FL=1
MNQQINKSARNSKTIWMIVFAIILFIGVIFAWRYWGVPREKVIEDETANWKIYRSELYNFEIKYPSNWNAFDLTNSKILSIGVTFSPFSETHLEEKGGALFGIYPTYSRKTDREYAQSIIRGFKSLNPDMEFTMSDTFLRDVPAIKVEIKKHPIKVVDEQEGEGVLYFLTKDDKRLHINYHYPVREKERYKPIFEQMLSTFRFLE